MSGNEFKGTKGPWFADIRGGCAAIYPECRCDETPGCHFDDDRNIAYSNKNAKFNGTYWAMDCSVEHDFNLMAAAPELLDACQWLLMALRDGTSMDVEIGREKAESAIQKALGK